MRYIQHIHGKFDKSTLQIQRTYENHLLKIRIKCPRKHFETIFIGIQVCNLNLCNTPLTFVSIMLSQGSYLIWADMVLKLKIFNFVFWFYFFILYVYIYIYIYFFFFFPLLHSMVPQVHIHVYIFFLTLHVPS